MITSDQVSSIIQPALQGAAIAAMTLIVGLIHKAVVAFEEHSGVKVDAADEAQLDTWALKAAAFAEEQGTKWLKDKGEELLGSEKMKHALAYFEQISGITREDVLKFSAQRIEAALPELRAMLGQLVAAPAALPAPPKLVPPFPPAPPAPGKAA